MRDREIWASRIDIHGRDVDLDLGRQLLEVETANAVCAGAERSFELDCNPIGVVSNFQREFLRADCDASLIGVRTHLKRNTQLATGRACHRIRRPGDIRTANRAVSLDWNADSSLAEFVARVPSRTEAERALTAL